MRDPERIRRSNRVLIAIIVLCLLYGIISRISTGDNSFYLFGIKLFGTEETAGQAATEAATEEAADEAAAEDSAP